MDLASKKESIFLKDVLDMHFLDKHVSSWVLQVQAKHHYSMCLQIGFSLRMATFSQEMSSLMSNINLIEGYLPSTPPM